MTTSKNSIETKNGIKKVTQKAKESETLQKNLSEISDESLLNAVLDDLNKQVNTGGNIWKQKFLNAINVDSKQARKKARKQQLKLSETLLNDKSKDNAVKLQNFYKVALIDFKNFSSVRKESANYSIIYSAYAEMKKVLNLK